MCRPQAQLKNQTLTTQHRKVLSSRDNTTVWALYNPSPPWKPPKLEGQTPTTQQQRSITAVVCNRYTRVRVNGSVLQYFTGTASLERRGSSVSRPRRDVSVYQMRGSGRPVQGVLRHHPIVNRRTASEGGIAKRRPAPAGESRDSPSATFDCGCVDVSVRRKSRPRLQPRRDGRFLAEAATIPKAVPSRTPMCC